MIQGETIFDAFSCVFKVRQLENTNSGNTTTSSSSSKERGNAVSNNPDGLRKRRDSANGSALERQLQAVF
jgi:hypothetical protein